MNFFIGVVNCAVDPTDIHNTTVSASTLRKAKTSTDLEVFDAIHVFENYDNENFKLGIVEMDATTHKAKNYYHTRGNLLKHFQDEHHKDQSRELSAGIFIISEATNINSLKKLKEVLECVHFEKLTQFGYRDFRLEIISCATLEMSEILYGYINEMATQHQIRIGLTLYSGFVHNNVSYCYMTDRDYKRIEKNLNTPIEITDLGNSDPSTHSEHSDQSNSEHSNPSIHSETSENSHSDPSISSESDPEPDISSQAVAEPALTRTSSAPPPSPTKTEVSDEKQEKKSHLVQVLGEGLCNIASTVEDLTKYVVDKSIHISDSGEKVTKKLLSRSENIPTGFCIDIAIDGRVKTKEKPDVNCEAQYSESLSGNESELEI